MNSAVIRHKLEKATAPNLLKLSDRFGKAARSAYFFNFFATLSLEAQGNLVSHYLNVLFQQGGCPARTALPRVRSQRAGALGPVPGVGDGTGGVEGASRFLADIRAALDSPEPTVARTA